MSTHTKYRYMYNSPAFNTVIVLVRLYFFQTFYCLFFQTVFSILLKNTDM
jgi:hypothetical protein